MENIETDYYTHIDAKQNIFSINIGEIWKYRDLIWLFTRKNFVLTYKQTILGPIWILLNPFITSVMYTIVFGNIAGISTDDVPQILFYMGGNAVWSYFASSLNKTASTFTSNAGLFGKVYFPRLTMPISTVISACINFFIQFIMFGLFWVYFIIKRAVQPNWLYIPLFLLALIQLGLLALGFGIIVSSLTTKYRDLSLLVGVGVSLWMYGTPVVYPMSQIKNSLLKIFIHINPVTPSIETFRYIFLGKGEVSLFWWIYSCVFTLAVLLVGIILFNYVEKTFMDTV